MSDPKIDKLLADFLQADARARSKGITLESLYKLVGELADRQLVQDDRLDRYGRRLRANEIETERLSSKAEGPDWSPRQSDITGNFVLHELQQDRVRRESDHKWLRRKRWEWVAAAVGAVVMAMISAVVAFAVAKLTK